MRLFRFSVVILILLAPMLKMNAEDLPLQIAYFHALSDMTHCDKVIVSSLDGTVTKQYKLPINNGCAPPVWSPDGQYLAVYHPGLMLIDMQTGGIQVLNDLSAGIVSDTPVWSRDGNYLAWHEQHGGTATNAVWKLLHIPDKTIQAVTALSDVSIEPDTMQFMHVESDGLYTIGAGITPQRIFLPDTMDCTSPVTWFGLLFVCIEKNDLVLLDTLMQGGKSTNLTNTPDLQESNAQFSPNKEQIAYQVYDPSVPRQWLQIMAISGANINRLTDPTGDSYDVMPQWSLDGEYIAFERHSGYKGLDAKVYVIKPDGSDLQYIGDGVYPTWRPMS